MRHEGTLPLGRKCAYDHSQCRPTSGQSHGSGFGPQRGHIGQHHSFQYSRRPFPTAPVCSSVCSSSLGNRRSGQSFYRCVRGSTVGAKRDCLLDPPSLTSQYRAHRGRKKNDFIDAENVGRALLANPQLTPLHNAEPQRELQELTRAQRRLSEQLRANRGALQELMAESAVRKIIEQVIAVLLKQLTALEKQIQATIQAVMPSLLKLPGVGPIVAGVLLAETGDPKRFASPHHFASYCGAAPVERGSGQNRRMQINPGGNRRLNWALHIVAMVRLRMDGGRSKRFLEQAQLRGKTKRSALRLLKTYIARELFRVLSTGQLHSLPAEAHPIG